MDWCQIKRIVNLDTSKLSKKEIVKLVVAYLIFAILAVLTMFTNIIPNQYLILMVFILVFIISFAIMSLLSNFIRSKTGLRLVNYAQIKYKGWEETIDIIIYVTTFIFCLIGIIIPIALFA